MGAEPGDTEFRNCRTCGGSRRHRRGDCGWVCMWCGRFDPDPGPPWWVILLTGVGMLAGVAVTVGAVALAVWFLGER